MTAKYQDYLIRDFDTAENGNKAVGVKVWVYITGSSQLAVLVDEDGASLANPVITDSRGFFSFSVDEGFYDLKVDVGTDREQFLYKDLIMFGSSVFREDFDVYEVPSFSGNTFTLPAPANALFVTVNGRGLAPSDVDLDADGVTVTMSVTVTESDEVVARAVFIDPSLLSVGKVSQFSTVSEMVASFTAGTCVTLSYNRPVVSYWEKVGTGAGDMSDGTLALDNGGYAKIQIEPIMDVRAFGAWGDYNPETMPSTRVGDDFVGYAHDDSDAFINAIKNCDHVVSSKEDSFAIAKHVNVSYDNKTCDFSKSRFYWFGKSGAPVAVGRDRAMFEIHGEFGIKFQESGPWASWREGADTFPSDDAESVYSNEFILLSVGNAPSIPEETYMIRPSKPDYRTTNLTTRFQSDYRLGWTHEQATFSYYNITPIKNTTLKLGYAEDMTDYDYDERDADNNRMSASTTAMVYCYNCHVECYEAENWQYPVVMTYVTTDCEVRNIRLLDSHRESLSGIFGWGIAVQWNNALRPRSYNLAGQGNRRILDYTACAYAYLENVGGESTRDGETTTHGVYEHNLVYVNTRGFMSFAASGPDFGETSKNITVLHHHGSDVFAVHNVQNLSLTDVRANSIRVNSVGLRMDNCSLYDSGDPLVDNLCQISNFSKALGKPYPNDSAVISNSSLGSNGVVYLVDQEIGSDETITFSNCDIYLREGDFAGPANIIFDNCRLRPKNGTGTLVLVSNPTHVKFNNCEGYNVGFEVPETPAPVNGPTKVVFNGGEYVGENFQASLWSNRDIGFIVGNYVKFQGVHINWDNDTDSGLFFDPLGARNVAWYVKVTDCDIQGTQGERLSIPTARRAMRFGGNTIRSVTKDIGTLNANRIEYNTLELLSFSIE